VCERPQTWLDELGERAEREADEVGVVRIHSDEEDDLREGWI
jgi:hypothetical protein